MRRAQDKAEGRGPGSRYGHGYGYEYGHEHGYGYGHGEGWRYAHAYTYTSSSGSSSRSGSSSSNDSSSGSSSRSGSTGVCERPSTYGTYDRCWNALLSSLRIHTQQQQQQQSLHTVSPPTAPSSSPTSPPPAPPATSSLALTFSDIPWPPPGNPLFLEAGDGRAEAERKMRRALLVWHPDKFRAHCGLHLAKSERGRIEAAAAAVAAGVMRQHEQQKGA
ncbi:hypothetical protein CLOM_g24154 [Closterium sp. NIES-68]|nr:hypothetical protein CLOM_g24154 [Closterium sp. NIES-68]